MDQHEDGGPGLSQMEPVAEWLSRVRHFENAV